MTPEDLDKLEALAANPDAEFVTSSVSDFRELIGLARLGAAGIDVERLNRAIRAAGYTVQHRDSRRRDLVPIAWAAEAIAAEYAKLRETPR